MSKGLWNTYDFNITCKKCGSKNVSAYESDGYIYLTCNECEKIKKEKEFEDIYGKVPAFITNILKLDKAALGELLTKTNEAVAIITELDKVLTDDYNKGQKEGYDGGIVLKTSSENLINKVTELSDKLKGMYVIDSLHEYKDGTFILDIYLFKGLSLEKDMYEMKVNYYGFEYKKDKLIFRDDDAVGETVIDTFLMSGEIEGHIKSMTKYQASLSRILKNKHFF